VSAPPPIECSQPLAVSPIAGCSLSAAGTAVCAAAHRADGHAAGGRVDDALAVGHYASHGWRLVAGAARRLRTAGSAVAIGLVLRDAGYRADDFAHRADATVTRDVATVGLGCAGRRILRGDRARPSAAGARTRVEGPRPVGGAAENRNGAEGASRYAFVASAGQRPSEEAVHAVDVDWREARPTGAGGQRSGGRRRVVRRGIQDPALGYGAGRATTARDGKHHPGSKTRPAQGSTVALAKGGA
jgi:hypothetical protein